MNKPNYSNHKLEPCPFCGNHVHWCGEANEDDLHDCHHITCVECGYNFDLWHKDAGKDNWEDTLKYVADKWNTRI